MTASNFVRILTALLLITGYAGCATDLRPYTSGARPGRLHLLEDEVQRPNAFHTEIAPAGLYVATQENDDYIFYRGSAGVIEKSGFSKPVAVVGGIAVSKRDPSKARIYSISPAGANLSRYIRAQFTLKP